MQEEKLDRPLLLHSLAFFWNVIEVLLDDVQPKTICEIGVSSGLLTEKLIDYGSARNASYTGIDPLLNDALVQRYAGNPRIRFVQSKSLPALSGMAGADVYVVDGDHNYYTVYNELLTIFKEGQRPLVFLHDSGWPWGQRDQYCAPEDIPEPYRHDFSYGGYIRLGIKELQDTPPGFSGEKSDYHYASAVTEGGARNGVMSAIADFCADKPHIRHIHIPAVFGLSILYPAGLISKHIDDALATGLWHFAPLLDAMEQNRLALFLEWLNSIYRYDALKNQFTDANRRSDDLHAKFKDLGIKFHDLNAKFKDLGVKFQDLLRLYHERGAFIEQLKLENQAKSQRCRELENRCDEMKK